MYTRPRYISDEDKELARTLFRLGYKKADIARHLGVTLSAISYQTAGIKPLKMTLLASVAPQLLEIAA